MDQPILNPRLMRRPSLRNKQIMRESGNLSFSEAKQKFGFLFVHYSALTHSFQKVIDVDAMLETGTIYCFADKLRSSRTFSHYMFYSPVYIKPVPSPSTSIFDFGVHRFTAWIRDNKISFLGCFI